MASTTSLLDAMKIRRSIYALANESTIPDERIQEIVEHAVYHVPSPFNAQSARCVVLLKREHEKFWDFLREILKATLPEDKFAFYIPKLNEYRGGYGTILFYEDPAPLKAMEARWPMIASKFPQWSEHSSGMHQYAIWTALETEGLGCNLQHYDQLPEVRAQAEWKIPAEWLLKAQLVFGKPTGPPRQEKTFKPIEERVFVHGR